MSVTTPDGVADKQTRYAIEEALIAVYRRETRSNTTANFGRMVDGYKRSGKRSTDERGGPLTEGQQESNTEVGIEPLPWTNADSPSASEWMGLEWSTPAPLADAKHKREQLETDLIGAHWLATQKAPRDQF